MYSNKKLLVLSIVLLLGGGLMSSHGVKIGSLIVLLGWVGLIVVIISYLRNRIKQESQKNKSIKNKPKK